MDIQNRFQQAAPDVEIEGARQRSSSRPLDAEAGFRQRSTSRAPEVKVEAISQEPFQDTQVASRQRSSSRAPQGEEVEGFHHRSSSRAPEPSPELSAEHSTEENTQEGLPIEGLVAAPEHAQGMKLERFELPTALPTPVAPSGRLGPALLASEARPEVTAIDLDLITEAAEGLSMIWEGSTICGATSEAADNEAGGPEAAKGERPSGAAAVNAERQEFVDLDDLDDLGSDWSASMDESAGRAHSVESVVYVSTKYKRRLRQVKLEPASEGSSRFV